MSQPSPFIAPHHVGGTAAEAGLATTVLPAFTVPVSPTPTMSGPVGAPALAPAAPGSAGVGPSAPLALVVVVLVLITVAGMVLAARPGTERSVLAAGTGAPVAVMDSAPTGGREPGPPARVDVDTLKRATVLLVAGERRGSGAIVSADGLVLTNAHVVAPDAMGQGVLYGDVEADLARTPRTVEVRMNDGGDEPAEHVYDAKLVAADGYLDLALVQIDRTPGGRFLEPGDLDLPHFTLGDSREVPQDEDVTVLGYPSIADTASVTVVRGSVAGFVADARLRDNRSFINSTAPIAGGNSGGAAVDSQGRLIGVPTSERFDSSQRNSFARFRPTHLALPLIEKAEEARRSGEVHRDEHHAPAPSGEERLGDNVLVAPLDETLTFAPDCTAARKTSTLQSRVVGVAIPFTGFSGAKVDVRVDIRKVASTRQRDLIVGSVNNRASFDQAVPAKGCMLVTVPLAEALASGATYRIDVYVGGNRHALANNGIFRTS